MKTLSKIYISLLLLVIGAVSHAQHRVVMNAHYSVSLPVGGFKDYIPSTSFRGWNASVGYRINQKVALGLTTGFQDFYEKFDRQFFKDEEGRDISAVVSHSLQTIPLLATVHYTLSDQQRLQPYVAIGAGANLVIRSRYLGQFADNDNKFKFAARPEVGLFIPLKKESEAGLNIAGAFNYMPYNRKGAPENLNSFGILIGAKFPLR